MVVVKLPPYQDPPAEPEYLIGPAGSTLPEKGGHGTWIETSHPEVVKCMGSAPECAANGCQARILKGKPLMSDSQDARIAELLKELNRLGLTKYLSNSDRSNTREVSVVLLSDVEALLRRLLASPETD